jgi:hypothetical protein
MTNNVEDPRFGALRDGLNQSLGRLVEPVVRAAGRACKSLGVPEEQLVGTAAQHPNGVGIIHNLGVDQILNEASASVTRDGDKEAGDRANREYDDWYCQQFPDSRKARAIKARRGE